jgi:type I restriction enzyme R subunit
MTTPTEHKTVQSCILAYAQEIGWTYAPLDEAERRRGFDPAGVTPEEVLPQRNAKENAR